MALLGTAAMLLSFDIDPQAEDEHDDWHTREHLPERLSIPGFLRGSRWKATDGAPRYMVLYEVADLEVLSSTPYLERLNNPTPWTRKMMPSYRGMRRGLCRVVASDGKVLGAHAILLRFTAAAQSESALRDWAVDSVLPSLAALRGLASAHLLHAAAMPAMTAERQIRGRDQNFDWALLATGYRPPPEFQAAEFEQHGAAAAPQSASYRLDCVLGRGELATSPAPRR